MPNVAHLIIAKLPAPFVEPMELKIEVSKSETLGVHAGSQESGWVTLQADAAKTGLHTQGRWQADVEIATKLVRVLLAQILPTRVERHTQANGVSSEHAMILENKWIDILLHQIESEHASLCPLSLLELAAYRVVRKGKAYSGSPGLHTAKFETVFVLPAP